MVLIVLKWKSLISLLFEDECGQSAGKSWSARGGEHRRGVLLHGLLLKGMLLQGMIRYMVCCYKVWYAKHTWCGMVLCGATLQCSVQLHGTILYGMVYGDVCVIWFGSKHRMGAVV